MPYKNYQRKGEGRNITGLIHPVLGPGYAHMLRITFNAPACAATLTLISFKKMQKGGNKNIKILFVCEFI